MSESVLVKVVYDTDREGNEAIFIGDVLVAVRTHLSKDALHNPIQFFERVGEATGIRFNVVRWSKRQYMEESWNRIVGLSLEGLG